MVPPCCEHFKIHFFRPATFEYADLFASVGATSREEAERIYLGLFAQMLPRAVGVRRSAAARALRAGRLEVVQICECEI